MQSRDVRLIFYSIWIGVMSQIALYDLLTHQPTMTALALFVMGAAAIGLREALKAKPQQTTEEAR